MPWPARKWVRWTLAGFGALLVVDAVEIEHPRASIRITGLAADYEPLEMLAGRISADGATIDEASGRLSYFSAPSASYADQWNGHSPSTR